MRFPGGGGARYSPGQSGPIAQPPGPSSIRQGQESGNLAFDPRTRDVYDMWAQERNNAFGQEQQFGQQFGADAGYYQSRGRGYDNLVPDLYQDIWAGGGGYNPREREGIMGPQSGPNSFDSLSWNDQDAEGNFLTDDERTQIGGDPYGAFNYFGGQQDKLEAWAGGANDNQRETVNELRRGYGGAINGEKLGMSGDYVQNLYGSLNEGRQGMTGAIDTEGGRMYQTANDPNLGITDDYRRRADMTDAEVDQAAYSGANKVGSRYRAATDDLERRALQSGQASPLAIAAQREQFERMSAADGADAAVNAELNARQQQRDAVTGIERTRLGAEQYRSGLRMDAAGRVMNARVGAADRLMGAGMDAAQGVEGTRLGAERDISNRQMRAAEGTYDAAGSTERQIGDRMTDIGKYGATRGSDLYGRGEEMASNRATGIATNRQGARQYNQGQQWNRGIGINDRMSDRSTTIANARLGDTREGRAAASGQQNYFGNQYNTSTGRQLSTWQTGMEGRQGAVRGYGGWGDSQNQYGFGSNFSRAAGGAFGKLVGSGGSGYQRPRTRTGMDG
jgi:hypothetical protein